jgi:AcrR family transcriptional regulator
VLDIVKGNSKNPTVNDQQLPDALRAAAVDVINERGLSGFSLREVTRRAGVSHAAPAYHFHNAAGLLTSLAVEAFGVLRTNLEQAIEGVDDPVARFVALGKAYVRTGREHPAHCEVAFRTDVVNAEDPELQAAGQAAYALLEDCVRAIADRDNPALDVPDAANLAWCAMQGLIVLYPKISLLRELKGQADDDSETTAEHFCRLLVRGFHDSTPGPREL